MVFLKRNGNGKKGFDGKLKDPFVTGESTKGFDLSHGNSKKKKGKSPFGELF